MSLNPHFPRELPQPISFLPSTNISYFSRTELVTSNSKFLRQMYLFLPDKSSHVFSAITFTTSTHPLMRFPVIHSFSNCFLRNIFTFCIRPDLSRSKHFIKVFPIRPRIVLAFQKQYVSLRFPDQYFSALPTNISAKTIPGGGILQFPVRPKSEPIFVGFSMSHQGGQCASRKWRLRSLMLMRIMSWEGRRVIKGDCHVLIALFRLRGGKFTVMTCVEIQWT